MDSTPLHFTLREARQHFGDPRVLGGMVVAALVLGLSGPFGTFALIATLPRLAYWAVIVAATYAGGFVLAVYIERRWAAGWPRWARVLATGVPPGLLAVVVVAGLNLALFGPEVATWQELGLLVVYCLGASLAVIAISLLIGGVIRDRTAQPAAAGPASAPVTPPILDRVPLPQRGSLVALSVEDHYVNIITSRGKALVLMRLADAMRETAGVPGLQIHRSHWVATAAVVRARRSDGRLVLKLSTGEELPVSRSFLPAVRAAGLSE